MIADALAFRRGKIPVFDDFDLFERFARQTGFFANFAQRGLLSGFFFVNAIAMCGMPPLSGFLGKLLILDSARQVPSAVWIWGLVLSTSLLAIIGFGRAGSTLFWKPAGLGGVPPQPTPAAVLPLVAIGIVLAGLVLLTAFAGPLGAWLDEAAAQLYEPAHYIDAVLGAAGENE